VKLRIFTEPQQGADYATLVKVATAAEDLGFDAFFRPDHFRGTGLPGPADSWVTLPETVNGRGADRKTGLARPAAVKRQSGSADAGKAGTVIRREAKAHDTFLRVS